jgi:ubiquinone/menaquinone biosynthesis C-methylase UbiE
METAYLFLAVLVLLMYSFTSWYVSVEHFDDGADSVSYEDSSDIYDETYAAIYNSLWHGKEKLDYERVSIHDIALAEWPVATVKIVDLCCGTAPHACWLKNLGIGYTGVDISDAMIKKARSDCPSAKFIKGDITQVHALPQKSASHALLLNFSAYMFANPKIASDNAYTWLQPGGYFVVHLVDPDKFDPLLDLATPFAAFSLQKYSYERQTDSAIYFDKFKYLGRFNKKKGEDDATFTETFTYYDKADNKGAKYRENKNHWVMPSKEHMIDIFKTSGFRHVETVDLVRCGKEYQYLVYFTK